MSAKAKQLYSLSEGQLTRLVGKSSYPGAEAAHKQLRAILESGGHPEVFYSEFDGFSVLDDDDIDSFRRLLSIKQRARPFLI